MDDKVNSTANNFIMNEQLKTENRAFWLILLGYSIGFIVISAWLNSIRATASLWLVWPLIITQIILYLLIFIGSYNRSKVFGLNKNIAIGLFFLLAVLGRVNNWQLVILPLLVISMLTLSARNKKVSEEGKKYLSENKL